MSCSDPVSTHSGGAAGSGATSDSAEHQHGREIGARRRDRTVLRRIRLQRPDVAVRLDGDDADAHVEHHGVARIRARRERRAPFPSVGWPAKGISKVGVKMRTCASPFGRQDERRLGQVELQCQRLHRRVVHAARIFEDGQRIAGERRLGEDVDDAEGVATAWRTSGCACAIAVRRAPGERAEGAVGRGSSRDRDGASAIRGKFLAIDRVYVGS